MTPVKPPVGLGENRLLDARVCVCSVSAGMMLGVPQALETKVVALCHGCEEPLIYVLGM